MVRIILCIADNACIGRQLWNDPILPAPTRRWRGDDEDLKVGNFTLAFQDLSVPVSCLPIQINRVYDSRDKTVGDFGVGWRLDVQTIRLTETGEQGKNWFVQQIEGSKLNVRLNRRDRVLIYVFDSRCIEAEK